MRRHLCTTLAYIFILTLSLTGTQITHAAVFTIPCGDISELINAITTANSNGEADVIELATGCTYTLTNVNNVTTGPNGLPAITQTLTINGNGAIIERGSAAPEFRIMRVSSGSVTLRDLTLRNGNVNSAADLAAYGGNLFNNTSGTVVLINTTISGGIAQAGGGIFNNGSLTAINSTISGNRSDAFGGGIFNRDSLTLVNSLVSGNRAGHVGGGINNDAIAAVYNSTISGNFSEIGGGGFHNGLSTSTPTIKNSVIWGNNTQIEAYFTFIVEYNGIQGGFAGTGNLNLSASDPVFVNPRPADEAPTTAGDYRLSGVSPVIDMGSNAALPADTYDIDGDSNAAEPLPLDLGYTPRIKHGTVDMGVHEALVVLVNPTAINASEDGTTGNYTLTLSDNPSAAITVNLAFDASQITVNGETDGSASAVLESMNWNTGVVVTVAAVDDELAEGTQQLPITHTTTSTMPYYVGLTVPTVTVTVSDNDTITEELVTNGDFELAGTPLKNPANWNAKLLSDDKRTCGGKGYNSTDCAFRFQLNVTDTVNQRQLQQKVNISGLNAGDTLTLSAARRTQGFSGVGFVQVTAFYADNTKTKKKINLPKGTSAWKAVSKTLTLSQTPTKIVVLIRVTDAKGTAFVDQVSLTREVVLPLASTSTFTSESLRSIQR